MVTNGVKFLFQLSECLTSDGETKLVLKNTNTVTARKYIDTTRGGSRIFSRGEGGGFSKNFRKFDNLFF